MTLPFRGALRFRVLVSACFFAGLMMLLPHSLHRQETLGIDYPIFYKAANSYGTAEGYIYPPFLAWILYPLAQLPYGLSSLLWYLFTSVIFVAVVWKCLPAAPSTDERAKSLILLVSLLATAWLAILNAELGQVNGVVLFLMLFSVGGAASTTRAAAFLGIASAVKVSPLLALPFALMQQGGRWKWALIVCVGTVIAALALPLLFGYTFAGITHLRAVSENASANLGLQEYIGQLSYVLSGILLAVSLVVGFRSRNRTEVWFIPFLLMMVMSPVVRKAHLIYGMPLALLLDKPLDRSSWVPLLWAIGALGTMAWGPSAILGNTAALVLLLWDLHEHPERGPAGPVYDAPQDGGGGTA